MKEIYGNRLSIEWYSFPLEQVNSTRGADWKLWEQNDDYESKGLWALRAGEAAKQQGKGIFECFHLALLRAKHVDKKDIANREILIAIAREVGMDVNQFRKDLFDRKLLAKIGEDYTRGVEEHGVWGTPTLVFNGGQAAYLKLRPAPPPEEAAGLFEELFGVIHGRPYVVEIKRPRIPTTLLSNFKKGN